MNNEKKSFISGLVVGLAIMLIVTFGLNTFKVVSGFDGIVNKKVEYLKALLNQYYIGETDESAMQEGIYKGLIASVDDPYTVYYTQKEYEKIIESTKGSFQGIGVTVMANKEDNTILIVSVIDNSPAYEAQLRPGDKIIKVNGEEVYGDKLDAAVSVMRGKEGTSVKVTVYRESTNETLDMDITRRTIEDVTVKSEMLDNNIGYLKLTGFEEVSFNQFKKAYDELNTAGQKGMILDLRFNGGGQLTTAQDIADLLVPEGPIVYIEEKGKEKKISKASDANKIEVPLVVLVNGYSASASEVLTGAIKDYNVGKVVGTKTFGKGIVQTVLSIGDGSGVKITSAKYYTPSGVCIHDIGIEPDYVVELPEDLRTKLTLTKEEDTQLQKAVEVISEQIK